MQCSVDLRLIVSAVQSEMWKVVISESHLSKLHEMVRTDNYRSCHLQFSRTRWYSKFQKVHYLRCRHLEVR